jgi:UDP-GlcNAc:undecaprenyl-phosphate GlcNAc-1-phosphate transferase
MMQVFIISLLSCVVLILLLRVAAHFFGLVDNPGGRKQHAHPTPTVGGLAMYLAVLLAVLWNGGISENVTVLMGSAAALVMLGIFDDKVGLSVSLRMMIQVFLVLVVIIGAEGTVTHLGAVFGSDVQLGMFAVPFSVVAFVGGINAINMIDGADGMAGKMALITMLGVAMIFYVAGAVELLPLTWAMLGALVGFLLFNTRLVVRRAWVFMGDAGSMWLGFVLGWFMAQVAGNVVSAEPAVVLWLFGVPLLDTLTVMLRRKRRNTSVFDADRTHIHHVLVDTGLTINKSVLLLSGIQIIMVGIGVLFYVTHAPAALVSWSFVLLFAAYYYRLRNC